jgi:molybdopterin-guanine dinucleotide biosynthesis protein A
MPGADERVVGVAGVVLTGGDSRRMGRDKATLPIDGVPMAVLVAGALAGATSPVVAIGRPEPALAATGLEVIADLHPGDGPLGGLLTAFAWSPAPIVVVVACDLAELDAATVRAVATALADDPRQAIVVASREPGDEQPLCAAWRIALAEPVLARAFAAGERSIRRAWAGLPRCSVAVKSERVRNVNTPSDVPSPHGNP